MKVLRKRNGTWNYSCPLFPHFLRPYYLLSINQPYTGASEAKSALRFEISDLNYLHIHVYFAYVIPLDVI